jgi:hypothetical protein
VDTGAMTDVPRHNVRPDVTGRAEGPTPAERAVALPLFTTDVELAERWTGWDLTDWRW